MVQKAIVIASKGSKIVFCNGTRKLMHCLQDIKKKLTAWGLIK